MPSSAEQRLKEHAIQMTQALLQQQPNKVDTCKHALVGKPAETQWGAGMSECHFQLFSQSVVHLQKTRNLSEVYDFTSELAQLIEGIDHKIKQFRSSDNADVAKHLRDKLLETVLDFVKGKMDFRTFHQASNDAVNDAISVSSNPRHWMDLPRALSVVVGIFDVPQLSHMKTLLQEIKSGEPGIDGPDESEAHKPNPT